MNSSSETFEILVYLFGGGHPVVYVNCLLYYCRR